MLRKIFCGLKFFLVMVSLFCFYSCMVVPKSVEEDNIRVEEDDEVLVSAAPNRKWTILFHFCVDNDLSMIPQVTNYIQTLSYVKQVDKANGTNINILVMFDGSNANSWYRDGYYSVSGGNFSNDLIVGKSEIDSGLVNETKKFIKWAIANYPAHRYIYVVFNHGRGFDDMSESGKPHNRSTVKGVAFDDTSMDCLTHKELREITSYFKSKIGQRISLVLFYACAMGGVELAYELRSNANYLLSSEELVSIRNWSFETFTNLAKNPDMPVTNLGKQFCIDACNVFRFHPCVWSLINLRKVDNLANAINVFARALTNYITRTPGAALVLDEIAYSCVSVKEAQFTKLYYYDLVGLLKGIINSKDIYDGAVTNSIPDVLNAYRNATVFATNVERSRELNGLYILHNNFRFITLRGSKLPPHYPVSIYNSILKFGKENAWGKYMEMMENYEVTFTNVDSYENVVPDTHEPDDTKEQARLIPSADVCLLHSLDKYYDQDQIKIYLTAGRTYRFETKFWLRFNTDTWMELWDSDGNQVAYNDDISYPHHLYSIIYYTPSVSGYYYILVKELWGNRGDYKLLVQSL